MEGMKYCCRCLKDRSHFHRWKCPAAQLPPSSQPLSPCPHRLYPQPRTCHPHSVLTLSPPHDQQLPPFYGSPIWWYWEHQRSDKRKRRQSFWFSLLFCTLPEILGSYCWIRPSVKSDGPDSKGREKICRCIFVSSALRQWKESLVWDQSTLPGLNNQQSLVCWNRDRVTSQHMGLDNGF